MTAPFIGIDAFIGEYEKTLSAGERTTAERLLQVVSDRIRDLKPDANDDAAKQVTFEVVRDLLTYGPMELLSSFQNITSHRQEAGTFDAAMKLVDDYLTKRHRRILGISVLPQYYFGD